MSSQSSHAITRPDFTHLTAIQKTLVGAVYS